MADTQIGESNETETPSDSLRDAIAAAMTKADTPAETVAEKTAPAPAESAEKIAPETGTEDRPRGPDGKFLPKEEAEAAAKPKAEEKADPAVTPPETPKTEEKKADPAAPDPTARWSAADKAMFKTLPQAAQEFVTRRYKEMEGDYTKKTQEIADFKRTYEPVDQMFAPFKPQMKAQGWTEASLIKAWADVEKDLMEGRGVQRVVDIVKAYRLPLEEIAGALGIKASAPAAAVQPGQTPGTEAQLDPTVVPLLEKQFGAWAKPLMEQLQALSTTEQQRQAQAQRLEQQRQAAEAAAAQQKVTDFVNEKAADGTPLHPYFNDVASHMVALSKAERDAGRVPDLQAVYDQAVWAHPPTREKLLAAQQAALAEKSRQESLAKAAEAKKAAVSVRGAPGSGHAPKTSAAPKSLRDTIAEAAEAMAEA